MMKIANLIKNRKYKTCSFEKRVEMLLGLPSIEDRKKTLGDDYLIPDKYYK